MPTWRSSSSAARDRAGSPRVSSLQTATPPRSFLVRMQNKRLTKTNAKGSFSRPGAVSYYPGSSLVPRWCTARQSPGAVSSGLVHFVDTRRELDLLIVLITPPHETHSPLAEMLSRVFHRSPLQCNAQESRTLSKISCARARTYPEATSSILNPPFFLYPALPRCAFAAIPSPP